MKKVMISLVLGVCLVYVTGCASMLNYKRVQQNIVGERIMANGSVEQKQAVARGVKPTTVLSIIPTSDAKGAYVAVNLLELGSLPGFMQTFADAPVSSTAALIIDAGLVGLAGYAIQQATSGGGNGDNKKDGTTVEVNNSNGNNINVNSGDGTQTTTTEPAPAE